MFMYCIIEEEIETPVYPKPCLSLYERNAY